jgi:hypothetical protein
MVWLQSLPQAYQELEELREFYDPDTVELMEWIKSVHVCVSWNVVANPSQSNASAVFLNKCAVALVLIDVIH